MRVIVPIKRFAIAKQRLAGVRSPGEREELARAFAECTLRELARATSHTGVTVVSGEPAAAALARALGFDRLDDGDAGLNTALALALRATPAGDAAIVHADLPLFSAEEFDRVAALHRAGPARKMTLVADRFGDGTTVRFCRPGGAVPPLYGPGSARRHAAFAQAQGIAVDVVASQALSFDCDTPDDLALLAHIAGQRNPASRAEIAP